MRWEGVDAQHGSETNETVQRGKAKIKTEEGKKRAKTRWKLMREINNEGFERRGREEGRNKRAEC